MTENGNQMMRDSTEAARLDGLLRRYVDASLAQLEAATAARLRASLRSVEGLLARERNKGCSGHWAYDLNRHIALKQVRDTVSRLLKMRRKTTSRSSELGRPLDARADRG